MSGAGAPGEGATRVAAAPLLRAAARGEPWVGPHLLVREAGQAVRRVELGAGLTVGRGRAAALRLDDPGVSRLHARFLVSPDGGVTVEDLGSKNGVRHNGRALGARPTAIAPGDAVLVGETTLLYADPLAAPAVEAMAVEAVADGVEGGGAVEREGAAEVGLLRTPGLLLGAGAALLAAAGLLLAAAG